MSKLDDVIKKIEDMQKKLENFEPAYVIGEQLKDLCTDFPEYSDIILTDFENPDMQLKNCAAEFKAFADKSHKGSVFCITPNKAEELIRKFYGLPEAGAKPAPRAAVEPSDGIMDLADFL